MHAPAHERAEVDREGHAEEAAEAATDPGVDARLRLGARVERARDARAAAGRGSRGGRGGVACEDKAFFPARLGAPPERSFQSSRLISRHGRYPVAGARLRMMHRATWAGRPPGVPIECFRPDNDGRPKAACPVQYPECKGSSSSSRERETGTMV